MTNGWISVFDPEKPASGEEVLTLSYAGPLPAPEDMFADPDWRAYGVCTYFYPGDQADNELPPQERDLYNMFETVTFDTQGFYLMDSVESHGNLFKWRRIKTIEESNLGIVCWKHLDWPTPD